jgi:spermidine synthase
MEKVTLPEMDNGKWRVEIFTVDMPDFHSMLHGRAVPKGETFTRLMRNGTLVMSDTPAEMRDHGMAVRNAYGSCLINGLGLGMVLKNILLRPDVTDVTVVEISQELIDLVGPHYADPRLTIVCSSAFDYKPPKGKRYDMVWHDIWDDLCTDNLKEMTVLHRKYGRLCEWQGSWGKELLQSRMQRERKERRYWW